MIFGGMGGVGFKRQVLMIFISLILKTLNGNKNNLKVKDLQKEVVILLVYYHIQLVDNQIE